MADRIDLLAVDSEGAPLSLSSLNAVTNKLAAYFQLSVLCRDDIKMEDGEKLIRNLLLQAFHSSSAEAADSALDDFLDSPGSVINKCSESF